MKKIRKNSIPGQKVGVERIPFTMISIHPSPVVTKTRVTMPS